MKAVVDLELTKYCRWIRERGSVACKMFPDKSVDVLHLDANHSEEASCREVECWHKKVKPGGFLIADDVDWVSVSKSLKLITGYGYKPVIQTMQFAVYQKPNGS